MEDLLEMVGFAIMVESASTCIHLKS